MKKMRALVIGSVMTDLVVATDRVPRPGETLRGKSFARHNGGKGANQALALARAGAEVEFIGAVGEDDFGAGALRNLEDAGVGISRCVKVANAHTGVAMITLDTHAENTIIIAPGANEALAPHCLDGIRWGDYDAVVLQLEIFPDTIWKALREAAPYTTTFLTPAPVRPIPDGVFDCVDYLIPNEHEIAPLAPAADGHDNAGRDVARRTKRGVVLTVGRDGVRWFGRNGESYDVPTPDVVRVDTVGAGDCFTGYFVHSLGAGLSLRDALARACHAAALQVTRHGAQMAIPFAKEVEEFQSTTNC